MATNNPPLLEVKNLRVEFPTRRGTLLAVQVVVAISCFSYIGLARSQAIFAGTPLIVAVLSIILLKERVDARRWLAI